MAMVHGKGCDSREYESRLSVQVWGANEEVISSCNDSLLCVQQAMRLGREPLGGEML